MNWLPGRSEQLCGERERVCEGQMGNGGVCVCVCARVFHNSLMSHNLIVSLNKEL